MTDSMGVLPGHSQAMVDLMVEGVGLGLGLLRDYTWSMSLLCSDYVDFVCRRVDLEGI